MILAQEYCIVKFDPERNEVLLSEMEKKNKLRAS